MTPFSTLPKPLAQQMRGLANLTSINTAPMQAFNVLLTGMTNQPTENMTNELKQLVAKMEKLLNQMGLSSPPRMDGAMPIDVNKVVQELEVLRMIPTERDLPQELSKLIHAVPQEVAEISGEGKEKLIDVLKDVLEEISSFENQTAGLLNTVAIPVVEAVHPAGMKGNLLTDTGQAKQVDELWFRFEKLAKKVTGQLPTNQPIKLEQLDQTLMLKVKQIIQQMSKLETGSSQLNKLTQLSGQEPPQQLMANLLNNYKLKQSLPVAYQQHSTVTSKDVAKWVGQFLNKQRTAEPSLGQGFTQMISKVEQYVIHVNQSQSNAGMHQQLIDQLEQLIKSNRLFTNKAGNMEMNIRLRPQHLGDMTVKLVQMNGDMAVKILVSTQAAKEMLEGNMQQLRHMFSPQQVVIEKYEQTATGQFFTQDDKQSGEFNGRESQSDQSQEQQDDHSEEEVSFHELLMNEKV
ncbi:flagellar hook-length control protein FliK [Halobacillus amylolyticus]|uniref:Flagellar hook-length control protein FliK n=1 Tax=Halobacillus amylolyticus TaxID=2932259 RepID=A0ABY4HHM9_9BACI|nr:flagellar hook-length control protein FliK [Halobacillus amylolyticus]UOR13902.1 flagellar hook-length control protein FliK [Halobacillus amylolyticus]